MKSRLLLWKTAWFGEEFWELGTILPMSSRFRAHSIVCKNHSSSSVNFKRLNFDWPHKSGSYTITPRVS